MTVRTSCMARISVASALFGAFLGIAAVLPATAAQDALPPLAVFGRLPSLDDVALSPTGARLAFVMTRDDQRYLVVRDLATGKLVAAMKVGDLKLRKVSWLDERNLLLMYSTTSRPPFGISGGIDEWDMVMIYDIDKRKLKTIDFDQSDDQTLNVISGLPSVRDVNGDTTLYVPGYYVTDRVLPGLFKLDLQHWRTNLIAHGDVPSTRWVVDAGGNIAADLAYRESDQTWTLRARKDGRLRQVASGKVAIDKPYIVGFNSDGKSLIVGFPEPDGDVWKPLRLVDGSWGAPLAGGVTFNEVIGDRQSGRIVGGVNGILAPRAIFFDPTMQAHWNAVAGAFGNERLELVSHSDDFSKFVVRVFGAQHGYEYMLIDWKTVDAILIGDVYEDLPTIADVRRIHYKAADGFALTGFLTLPHGEPAKGLSLIVLPHGGPAASDDGDFDWWAQALASRGYAVLQVDFRGSDTTPALLAAGFGEWGRKMQTDLSDGVSYLAAQGIIDPKRVCIDGASYGGYAALAGVTLQNGIYRCAVSVAGVSDLRAFLRWTNRRMDTTENHVQRYWDRYLGVSGPEDPALNAVSPIDHVAGVSVPVLLIHGRDDTVVPYEQSEVMEKALERAGKSVKLVTLTHEDHWLSHSDTREQMLEATVAFLEANNPPN